MLNYPVFFKTMDARSEAVVREAVTATIKDAEQLWAPEKFGGVFGSTGFGIKRLQIADLAGQSSGGTSIVCGPLSNTAWVFSFTTAETWQPIISGATMSDSAYIILTGFFNFDADPDVECIKITADGVEYAVMDLQEVKGWDVATVYWSHPIVIRPEKKVTIEAKARTAGSKNFGFLGYVVAKRSYLIAKV
jgi:hypothetical protein